MSHEAALNLTAERLQHARVGRRVAGDPDVRDGKAVFGLFFLFGLHVGLFHIFSPALRTRALRRRGLYLVRCDLIGTNPSLVETG